MRKKFLASLSIAIIGMASYATTIMEVNTQNGEIVKFNVDEVNEVVFSEEAILDTTPESNHAYVDLGLPSGTLWATYNIGATKPEEYGDYFAWGETEPKKVYTWSTYKYAETSGTWDLDSFTKYNFGNSHEGVIDSLSTLLPEDDAATANWGKEWRMPTREEQIELMDECEYSWTKVNGVYGAKFTGSNGNSVFFPAAGLCNGWNVILDFNDSYYLSSSLYDKTEDRVFILYLYEDHGTYFNLSSRFYGHSVRAVRAKK